MSASNARVPVLPNEVWVDILRHLSLETLWYKTRPVCSLFYYVSTSLVKSALVEGSTCELRHYISCKDPLLSEQLHYPSAYTDDQRRILEQEGHSPFSQILLWASPTPSPANPCHGPGIPTVNYESADGKRCVTMAVFGQQDRSSTSQTRTFHCRRTGCLIPDKESASDGHVCLAGCWHVHFSRVNRTFCATIPLALLLPIYLRLESATREWTRRAYAVEKKGRWMGGTRHGVSASVSPLTEIDDMNDNLFGGNQAGPAPEDDGEGDDNNFLPGTLMELSEDEDGYLDGLFDVYTGQMDIEG